MKSIIVAVLAASSTFANAQANVSPQQPACTINAVDNNKIKSITDKYSTALTALRNEAQKGA